MEIKQLIKRVIQTEANGIIQMQEATSTQYDEVVDALLRCEGKVVFMGIGKSGHIGAKLAATFASTGTPSFFVHAAEARHGDFGMIERKDVVILISNSGNTSEVVDDIPFLKNIGCVTIALTSNPDSILALGCDYKLIFPKCDEADELNLAPTVSSTLTLVLGDAIACTLSAMKKFTRNDFYKFHPGGALGAKLSNSNSANVTSQKPLVTVVGSFVTDMVARVERFPNEGETLLGKNLRVYLGGKGINQCVALQRLGVPSEMIGTLGNDANGEAFRKIMTEEGIKQDKVFVSESEPTAVAQIQINDNAENKIIVIPSANHELGFEQLREIKDSIKNSKLVVTQLELKHEITFELIRMCKRLNVPVLLNPAPAVPLPDEILQSVDYLTPNEVELSILADSPTDSIEQIKTAAKKLINKGVKNIIATLGGRGALVANKDTMEIIEGYEVEVVDTVGAGDSFNGALAKCIVEGVDLLTAAKFANAMGALTVTVKGAIPSIHTLAEVQEFIKQRS